VAGISYLVGEFLISHLRFQIFFAYGHEKKCGCPTLRYFDRLSIDKLSIDKLSAGKLKKVKREKEKNF